MCNLHAPLCALFTYTRRVCVCASCRRRYLVKFERKAVPSWHTASQLGPRGTKSSEARGKRDVNVIPNPSNKQTHPSRLISPLPSPPTPLRPPFAGVELCEAYDADESRRNTAEAEASAAASDAMRKRGANGADKGKKGKVGGPAALVMSNLNKQQVVLPPYKEEKQIGY